MGRYPCDSFPPGGGCPEPRPMATTLVGARVATVQANSPSTGAACRNLRSHQLALLCPNVCFLSTDPRAQRPTEAMHSGLHMIAQHQLLGIRVRVHLLVHPLGHRIAVQGRAPEGAPWQKPTDGFCSYPQELRLLVDSLRRRSSMRPRSSNLPQVGLVVARQVVLEITHQMLEHVHMVGLGRFACSPFLRQAQDSACQGLPSALPHTRPSVRPSPAC